MTTLRHSLTDNRKTCVAMFLLGVISFSAGVVALGVAVLTASRMCP